MITKNVTALALDATLHARGLRLTRQRRIILEVVRATDAHPTAALVYRRVRRRLPRGSLATGYRNLRTRSEEHTSELQSPFNLAWRLLLEKKKHEVRVFGRLRLK